VEKHPKQEITRFLRMKCKVCGHWNRIEVNKGFIEQPTSEPKVKAYVSIYEPLRTETCKKCGKVIADSSELITVRKKRG
jgi:hypothetical protein